MIQRIETHNKIYGYLFSAAEFVFTALAALLIAALSGIRGSWIIALCFLGIALNSLIVAGFAFCSLHQKQAGGHVLDVFYKSKREQMDNQHPGLLGDTLLLVITTLIPFVLLALTIWEMINSPRRLDN